jgi:hypothetical protein
MRLRTTYSIISRWIGKHYRLLQGLIVVGLFQLLVISYTALGKQLIAYIEDDRTNEFNCLLIIYHRLDRLDVMRMAFEVGQTFIIVFAIEFLTVWIYSFCKSLRSKRIAAIAIWLFPLVLWIGSLPYAINAYLFSPLASLYFSWELVNIGGYCRQKDFYPGEGLLYGLAMLGVFNLFWTFQIAQSWIFPIHPKSKV